MPPRWLLCSLAWGSSRASSSLALASAGWMLSGLSPSPLINGLLPALVTLAGLLPIPCRRQLGSLLQLLSLVTLLALAGAVSGAGSDVKALASLLTLLAGTLLSVGEACALPLVRAPLLEDARLSPQQLRSGSELGRLVGLLLTALLFPLGHALLQFSVAIALLLPQLPLLRDRLPERKSPRPSAAEGPEPAASPATVRQPPFPVTGGAASGRGWHAQLAFLLQGLLFGALFALMPLWVRRLEGGNCFDFGMVLSALGLGRLLASGLFRPAAQGSPSGWLQPRFHYAAMGALLLLGQGLPGWLAVVLFVPFGLLAGLSDQGLSAGTAAARQGWLGERFTALGALLGSLTMGGFCQLVGLAGALPLQLAGFVVMAVLLPGRRFLGGAPAGAEGS